MNRMLSRLRHAAFLCVVFALASCSGTDATAPDGSEPPGTPPVTPPVTPPPPAAWPVVTHSGNLCGGSWITWQGRTIHRVTGDIRVCATRFIIEADAIVEFDGPYEIVLDGTALDAIGTSAEPIRFRARTAGANWGGLRFIGGIRGAADIQYVRFDDCGLPRSTERPEYGYCLVLGGNRHHLDNVVVNGSDGAGVSVRGRMSMASRNVSITGSALEPLHVSARFAGLLPNATLTENGRAWIVLESGGYGLIGFSEDAHQLARIPNLGVPYRLTGSLQHIGPDAAYQEDAFARARIVEIEAGVQLEFPENGALRFGGSNEQEGVTLRLLGTASQPVRLVSQQTGQSWCGLSFGRGARRGTHVLTHVYIDDAGPDEGNRNCRHGDYGGAGALSLGNFEIDGTVTPTTATYLHVRDVRIRRFGSYGLHSLGGVLFTDSSSSLIFEQGRGLSVLTSEPNFLGTFPANSSVAGGAEGIIRLALSSPLGLSYNFCRRTVEMNGTWPAVPIDITGGHLVISSGRVVLQPGTEISMDPAAAIIVGGMYGYMCNLEIPTPGFNAGLAARGELGGQILMRSNRSGQLWGGIVFNGTMDAGANALEYVDVSSARSALGGATAAIRVLREGRGQFIKNSRIAGGGSCGIARVRAGGAVFTTDFLAPVLGNQVSGHTPLQC